jgi:pimeloyl-ACP methyl ester carboxylesterase
MCIHLHATIGFLRSARQNDYWAGTAARGGRLRRPPGNRLDFTSLWDDLASISAPVMLVRGSLSGVVTDDDVAEFARRRPGTRVESVDGAGHSLLAFAFAAQARA